MIKGSTKLIAHLGYPTTTFKAPMIYNPWFEFRGIDAIVVPMGVRPEDYADYLRLTFRLSNIHGALVTMPHKVATVALADRVSVTAQIAGSANALRLGADGLIEADMFDGEGFVAGVLNKGQQIAGASVLVVGAGGVGSAIAASLAKAGAAHLALFDPAGAEALAGRLTAAYPDLKVTTGSKDPAGFDIVVNASPLGMKPEDPLPMDVSRIDPATFVGEVVMKAEMTPFLAAAAERGCRYQVGTDMLFEQIPAYLDFFGFGKPPVQELRDHAAISY
ncbi:shikimate dehydrogenase family protein [Paracoccus shanxieyensis]|uniref:Shikimate dehydrogenase n=1 Tax=Paracoccus shanxieyensis TaxID=2675752 RepID=A0A6L6J0C9_9RHOB|nr:ThiF family adenylyltransferase [Paracoccus shanxieyensis]MTH66256.1 shikimate dehydrogenase [Paracoccus shanxieyensis]MTH89518.1 shikimate dehydrogenase [Paracoccus shanxieyensis]